MCCYAPWLPSNSRYLPSNHLKRVYFSIWRILWLHKEPSKDHLPAQSNGIFIHGDIIVSLSLGIAQQHALYIIIPQKPVEILIRDIHLAISPPQQQAYKYWIYHTRSTSRQCISKGLPGKSSSSLSLLLIHLGTQIKSVTSLGPMSLIISYINGQMVAICIQNEIFPLVSREL